MLILSVFALALFFNIERLNFDRPNLIDIASFVYVLGLFAVLTVLTIPLLARFHPVVLVGLWVSLYLISKFFVFNDRPLLGGIYTYLTVTELTLLSGTVWVSHRLAQALLDFEQAVENITLVNGNRQVRHLDDASDDIQVEMFRSRHNHYPLSVVVVEPTGDALQLALQRAVQEMQQTLLNSYVITNLAHALSRYLRRSDLVLQERERGRFIILCPDTSARDMDPLVEYIQATAGELLGVSVNCGTATFPDEALTFEELILQAEAKLNYVPSAST